ncbi:MAG: DUF3299 domain-containing protein [Helicobacteraceae bacterium]|jgi:hypothetical protein|nr:DUF3299 domain-containing protein [Helicobacteraceae bacterium]
MKNLIIFVFAAAVMIASSAIAADYREIEWEELIPKGWDPTIIYKRLGIANIDDYDPKALKLLKSLEREWAMAPPNEAMSGKSVKIAGFIAPIEWLHDKELGEFLLVPYFGACIHSPAPPANQIIYIKAEKPLKGVRSMDLIMVYGKLGLEKRVSGSMGTSGYTMKLDKFEIYKEPKK